MRYLLPLAVVAGSAVFATPALAQADAPFTGPRIEALLGYDALHRDGPGNGNRTKDGLLYGGAIGYDMQLGGAIVGIEGEATGSTAKLRPYDIINTGDAAQIRTDRDLYVGGRVGFAAAPSTLVYVKGGYTNLRVKSAYQGTSATFDEARTLDGWRVGVGIEQKFNIFGPSGYVKAEYRYSNYSNLNLGNLNANVDLDRHQVVAGVGVRF